RVRRMSLQLFEAILARCDRHNSSPKVTRAGNIARRVSNNHKAVRFHLASERALQPLGRDLRKMIPFFGIASKGASCAKVMSDSRDSELCFGQTLDVARQQARNKTPVFDHPFEQIPDTRAKTVDLSGLGHPIQQ